MCWFFSKDVGAKASPEAAGQVLRTVLHRCGCRGCWQEVPGSAGQPDGETLGHQQVLRPSLRDPIRHVLGWDLPGPGSSLALEKRQMTLLLRPAGGASLGFNGLLTMYFSAVAGWREYISGC